MSVLLTLIVIALVLSATASPLEPRRSGISIPLSRRKGLTTPDGHFDYDRAIREYVRAVNKHRNNLINIQRNLGTDAWNEGARILPAYTPPYQKRQSVNLTDQDEGAYWAGNITIGTPGRTFVINFDTGSSDLWVPGDNCTDIVCTTKNLYDPSQSSTSQLQRGNFTIHYADGSTVSGPVFTDTVSIAGVNVTGQFFSPVNNISASFGNDVIDGILGLGLPDNSNLEENPFVYNAKAQGKIQVGEFGLKLTLNDSELYIGGTNTSQYNGTLEYHSIHSTTAWQVPNATVLVEGLPVVSNFSAIIDSGTSIIYGPESQVRQIYQNIQGSEVYDQSHGLYSVPCDSIPTVAFNWGGLNYSNFSISTENFNLGTTENVSQCIGAISSADLGLGNGIWLVGDSFMQNVYTAFSLDNSTVGFAMLR